MNCPFRFSIHIFAFFCLLCYTGSISHAKRALLLQEKKRRITRPNTRERKEIRHEKRQNATKSLCAIVTPTYLYQSILPSPYLKAYRNADLNILVQLPSPHLARLISISYIALLSSFYTHYSKKRDSFRRPSYHRAQNLMHKPYAYIL